MLHIKLFHFNLLEACCIVLWHPENENCVVVDPGMCEEDERRIFLDFLKKEGLSPCAILLTHGHFDHIFGVEFLQERFQIPVYFHPKDWKTTEIGPGDFHFKTTDIQDGDVLDLAGMHFQAIATPGHSPGGVCWWLPEEQLLLSGDTLFAGSIGRSDLPGGDYDVLMHSLLERVMVLPSETEVIPGHGPKTSIGAEAASNPFLLPFNEADGPWWEQDPLSLNADEDLF